MWIMAIYTNLKCPYCASSLTGNVRSSGMPTKLGVPFIQCAVCKRVSKTGKLPWSKLSARERTIEMIGAAVSTLYGGLLFGVPFAIFFGLCSGTSTKQGGIKPSAASLIFAGVCGIAISTVRSVLLYKKTIPLIENITQEERWDKAVMMK